MAKKKAVKPSGNLKKRRESNSSQPAPKTIRPVVMYPFSQPKDLAHIDRLFRFLEELNNDPNYVYARPITVINRQTHHRSQADPNTERAYRLGRAIVEAKSDVVDAWSIDTCNMWLSGFGEAMARADLANSVNDVFWLIPGDFHYDASPVDSINPLTEMSKLPRLVYDGKCELSLGEIRVPPSSSKQLIDTYGTYGLLYNWFPAEAQGIRRITSKPRSEFFAIQHDFLKTAMVNERWYGYEQTIVILLQNMRGQKPVRRVESVALGGIEDDPSARSSLASAMQQIERTERVIKQFWRELNETKHQGDWPDLFKKRDLQSEQIRAAAMTIMQQILP